MRIRAKATRTNTPPNGAFRGFGAPQTEFAAETHLNRIAERLAISPLDIRRRNVYGDGDTTPTGQILRESVAGEEVLERAAEAAEFVHMATKVTAIWRYGAPDIDFDATWDAVRGTLLEVFADHDSPSVQTSIWIMDDRR